MGADKKTTFDLAPQAEQSPDVLADKGRGDMVSENLAANERFERNSTDLQERPQPDQVKQQQGAEKGLTFGLDRQHGRNLGQLKVEQAKATVQERGREVSPKPLVAPESAGKKTLSFGADRHRGRNLAALKAEQAKVPAKGSDQEQGEKKELSFGADRGQGKGRAPGLDHGR